MARQLDLADIQGGILRDYGGDFPKGRFIILNIPGTAGSDVGARRFVEEVRGFVTTAVRWDSKAVHYPGEVQAKKPAVTFNIGFTFHGLRMLGLPTRSLQRLPDEFIDGMCKRAHVLGDTGRNGHDTWDDPWRPGAPEVHVVVAMRAQAAPGASFAPVPELDSLTGDLLAIAERHGLTVLAGHRGPDPRYQDASALFAVRDGEAKPLPKEHFGFDDGISEVVFDEQGADLRIAGGGKISRRGEWEPLATGEFLVGHPDESQELPPSTFPSALMRNGTFLAYRKLHQNVKAFRDYVAATAAPFAALHGASGEDAAELLKAKMIGRWTNGVPVSIAPTAAERDAVVAGFRAGVAEAGAWLAQATAANDPADANEREARYQAKLADARRPYVDFRYGDDGAGAKCPLGAHIRRSNTRDMLDVVTGSSVLNNRRRLLRRGLPYGSVADPADDDGEHGVIFLAYCASLFRQFEFVQQQWLQYGLDFNAGNDRCPILGNRVEGESHKFVVASDPESGKPPFICADLPQFVETRGGAYFFMPSLTALRMIAMGTVDPT